MTRSFRWRFQNWVRWSRSVGRCHGKAGSVEGEYRSPQIWDERLPRGESVDVVDAIFLNRVYLGLPERVRRVIKIVHFRSHWRREWQAQKLGVHHLKLEQADNEALGVFEGVLARSEESAYIPRYGITVKPLLGGAIFT